MTFVKVVAVRAALARSARLGVLGSVAAVCATLAGALGAVAGPPAAAGAATAGAATAGAAAACAGGSGYDARVLADRPVAYWRLGEAGGTVADCAGTHTGRYVGGPGTTRLPNGDAATVFDGVRQYAEIPDADDLSVPRTGVLTVEAWLRPDVLQFTDDEGTGYVHWAGKGGPGQHEYVTRMYSRTNSENRPNRISGYAFNRSGGLGVGSYFQDAVPAGAWIHVTLVLNTVDTSAQYPTGYTKIYKNGVRRDQDDLSALGIVPANGTAPVRLGTRDLNSFFQGALGKVALYGHELPAAAVLDHYRSMTAAGPLAGSG